MFILKTKGISKIPDYVQIRDNNFVLICHFRADKPEQALRKQEFNKTVNEIREIIEKLQYGILTKIEL